MVREKAGTLELMGDRLSLLPSHDALLLLRHSFAIPKVLYLVRTAPCFLSPELKSILEHVNVSTCEYVSILDMCTECVSTFSMLEYCTSTHVPIM